MIIGEELLLLAVLLFAVHIKESREKFCCKFRFVKAIPVHVGAPRFHEQLIRSSPLGTGRLYPQEIFLEPISVIG
jgi:hypothetical protein